MDDPSVATADLPGSLEAQERVGGANPREFTWILEGQKLQNIVIVGFLYSFSWVEITILWNTNSNRNG